MGFAFKTLASSPDENDAENSMRKEGWGGVQIENLEIFMQSANLGSLQEQYFS
jgi:hypothetical protein